MRCLFSFALLALFAAQLPRFETALLLETAAADSASISLGDLNGDGLPDLILAKGRHKPDHNRVLLNDGNGGFVASNLGPTPDRTYSAALADIDLDGDLDVLVSNDAPDAKLIYLNDGKAHFAAAGTFGEPGWTTRYITLADLNADRYPDIIVANRGGDRTAPSFVCINNRNGGFPICRPLPTQSATSIAAADLDRDGAIDLFVPHRDGGQSVVLWNDGKGNFGNPTDIGPSDANARIGVAGDLNGDGLSDLVYIDERLRTTSVVLNTGKRKFSNPSLVPWDGPRPVPYALALFDLNGDRHLDVVVGYNDAPGAIHLNDGHAKQFETIRWNEGQGHVYGMAFHDLNGDGRVDIIAARSGAPNAVWLAASPRR